MRDIQALIDLGATPRAAQEVQFNRGLEAMVRYSGVEVDDAVNPDFVRGAQVALSVLLGWKTPDRLLPTGYDRDQLRAERIAFIGEVAATLGLELTVPPPSDEAQSASSEGNDG